ncbi:MAG: ROK family protein [Calditrichaeota bacterium]|nr:ROK family protein [Calditrichota bacterium]
MSERYLGMDVGGTKLAVLIGTSEGTVLEKVKRPTHAERGPWPIIDDLVDMAEEVLNRSGTSLEAIDAVGVSIGGPLDSAKGIIYSPPNLPGWDEIPLKQILSVKLERPVFVENDANAGALAEWRFGAGRGAKNMVFLTAGTGMGAGLILDNRLFRGANDLAGEVWKIPLIRKGLDDPTPLEFEYLTAGPGLARLAQNALRKNPFSKMLELTGGDIEKVTGEIVGKAARADDRLALQVLEEAGTYLGWGLAILVDVINPELFVIGTLGIHLGDLLLEPARKAMRENAVPQSAAVARVVPAQLDETIGDVAALCVAMEKYEG